jgi:glycerol-1-phosphate dehydrogenase [NAD(P)+]
MTDLAVKVQELLSMDSPCACGRRHTIETAVVETASGAVGALGGIAGRLKLGGPSLMVADPDTMKAAGERAAAALSGAGIAFKTLVLERKPGRKMLHADDALVGRVEAEIAPGTAWCLACGAGTINDLVKLASFRKGVPYMALATAASMNGYTSAIAAIEVAGIKRTVNCHQPVAVVGDMEVITAAPPEMKASGVGDLLSKPVCNADWILSHLIRGEYYCDLPAGITADAAAEVGALARKIRENDPGALSTLFHALLLSGFSMKIAGSSSPASGGEHLISHYWDMRAEERGREPGLHGAQVGVASMMSARVYLMLRERWVDLLAAAVVDPARHEGVMGAFKGLYGGLAGEVRAEYMRKFPAAKACREDIEAAGKSTGEIEKRVWPALADPADIRGVLLEAGSPVTFAELGLSRSEALEAVVHGREIRGRYTVLDLAWELGLLPGEAEEIVKEAEIR